MAQAVGARFVQVHTKALQGQGGSRNETIRVPLSDACILAVFSLGALLFAGCSSPPPPAVQFTQIPDAGPGAKRRR